MTTNGHANAGSRGTAIGMAFFALLALAFCLDTTVLGPLALVRVHDSFDGEFFQQFARGRLLLEHGLFNWSPIWAGGAPSFAGQFTPYYLVSLLSTFVPMWLVNAALRLGFSTLAGWGTYRLLRERLGASTLAAALGGGLFLFTSQSLVVQRSFEHVFPIFFVWSLDLFQHERPLRSRLARLGGILLLILLSYPVITLPFFSTAHLWLVLGLGAGVRTPRHVAGVFALWTGYLLLFAPTLVSLLQYIPLAQRDYPAASYPDLWAALKEFLRLFTMKALPNPGLLLTALALPLLLRRRHATLALSLIILPSLVGAFFIGEFSEIVQRSFLAKMDLGNFDFLVPLGYSMILALALDALCVPGARGSRWSLAAGATLLGAMRLTGVADLNTLLSNLAFLAVGVCLARLTQPGRPKARTAAGAGVCLALGVAAMLALQHQLLENYHVMYGKWFGNHQSLTRLAEQARTEPFRVGCVNLPPSVPHSYGLESPEHRGPLSNKYYKQLFGKLIEPQLETRQGRDFFNGYWYNILLSHIAPRGHEQVPLYRASNWKPNLLRLMNIRYLVSFQPIEGIEAYADLHAATPNDMPVAALRGTALERFATMPLWVYEVRGAFPRGWLAGSAVRLSERAGVLEALARADTPTLADTVFLAEEDIPAGLSLPTPGPKAVTPGQTRLTRYSPDQLVFEGQADSPCLLVVANNFDPHWSATINGRPATIFRADHAFQAVAIPGPGPFRAELTCTDPLPWKMHWASLAGLALLCCVGWIGRQPGASAPQPGGTFPRLNAHTPSLPLGLASGAVAGAAWLLHFVLTTGKPWANGYFAYWCVFFPLAALIAALWARWLLRLAGSPEAGD